MPWRAVLRWALGLAALLYVGLGALTLSLRPDGFWVFEALSNLRAQWAVLGAVGAVALVVARMPLCAGLVAIACGAHIGMLANDRPDLAVAETQQPANLRVMTINIDHARNTEALIAQIRAEQPDVLVLIEDFPEVRRAIAEQLGFLPYHAETGIDLRAVSIDSRYPLLDVRVESQTYVAHILTARIELPAGGGASPVFFIATHPTAPVKPWLAHERRQALAYIARRAAEADLPVIVAGDFNLTSHSALFRDLQASGGLRDTALGRFPKTTWFPPLPGFSLRIDHVLVSRQVRVAGRRVGTGFGSDHRALTVDLRVPPPSETGH